MQDTKYGSKPFFSSRDANHGQKEFNNQGHDSWWPNSCCEDYSQCSENREHILNKDLINSRFSPVSMNSDVSGLVTRERKMDIHPNLGK